MVIIKGKNKIMNLEYCELKQHTLEDSIKFYNYMMICLNFSNPLNLELDLNFDPFTAESSVVIISTCLDIKSEDIKNFLLGFFN